MEGNHDDHPTIALAELAEKGADVDVLRQMVLSLVGVTEGAIVAHSLATASNMAVDAGRGSVVLTSRTPCTSS